MAIFAPFTCEAALSSFFDLLLWDLSEETTSVWSTITTTPSTTVHDYQVQNVNFDWKPGFRGGLLYGSDTCFWDSKLYWTYYSTDKKYQIPAYGNIISPEFFSGFLSLDPFFGANIDWRVMFNMIDYNLSHAFSPIDDITLRPAIGIRIGTIHQNIHAYWDADVFNATEKVKNNFSGLGPTFGLDGRWNIYNHFALIGNFSTAFMWGNWKVSDIYNRPGALLGLIAPTTITTTLNNSTLGTLTFEFLLGLEWIYRGHSDLTIQLGYEMQFWPNQLRLTTFQQLPTHGDLTLQGAMCRIYIDL